MVGPRGSFRCDPFLTTDGLTTDGSATKGGSRVYSHRRGKTPDRGEDRRTRRVAEEVGERSSLRRYCDLSKGRRVYPAASGRIRECGLRGGHAGGARKRNRAGEGTCGRHAVVD